MTTDAVTATTSADAPSAEPRLSHEQRMRNAISAARRRRRQRSLTVVTLQILTVSLLLGLWELFSRTGVLPNANIFYGRPSGVGRFLWDNRSDLWMNTKSTLYASVMGFSIGSVGGVVVGMIFARWDLIRRAFDPLMTALASLPRIALAPLFLLWFGITDNAKIAVAVSGVFFVVLFNTVAGVRQVDRDLQTVARLLGAKKGQIFFKVLLPGAVPVLFAGLRLALIFSTLGVVASEMIAARHGLGTGVVRYGQNLEPNGVFAVLAILAAMVAIFNVILRFCEARLLRWQPER